MMIVNCHLLLILSGGFFIMNEFDMYSKKYCANFLCDKYKKQELVLDIGTQRGEVWSNTRKSLYIQSMLLGITEASSPFVINTNKLPNGHKSFRVLDGKQRSLTIIEFINNDFALTGLMGQTAVCLNGEPVKLQGKRFKRLDPELQERIINTNINISFIDEATSEQEAFIFRMLNNGKPVSRFDKSRSYKQDMSDIRRLTDNELFNVMFSEIGKKAFKHEEFIVKVWVALFEENPQFTGSHIEEVMKELTITSDEEEQIRDTLNFIFEVYKHLAVSNKEMIKSLFNIVNVIAYVPYIGRFDTTEQFVNWFVSFYTNVPEEYDDVIKKNHTSNTNIVLARRKIIEDSIDNYLATVTE